jgi:hypothetical protein
MSHISNSQTVVESLISRYSESLERGKRAGRDSLEAYRDAGAALLQLKDLLPRGQFGSIALARCGCSKQWRARLMQIDREWNDVVAALGWAETGARELLRKAYSVDGALLVLKAWRRAQNGHSPQESRARRRQSDTEQGERRAQNGRAPQEPRARRLHSDTEQGAVCKLKQDLSAAAAYIAVLEEEHDGCAANSSGDDKHLDDLDRSKVQKVATLWRRPGTEGEGKAAARTLRALARRLGRPLGHLLQECGIDGPADWTFTSTH